MPDPGPIFLPVHPEHVLLYLARLGLAAALGAIVGINRELIQSAAGLRTHVLVCLGAAIMVLAGEAAGFTQDSSSRVIQGILAGIGFLGGGTILKLSDKVEVHGLTTAASIWLTAGVGIAAGLGHLWLSIVGTLVAWLVLGPLKALERRHIKPPKR